MKRWLACTAIIAYLGALASGLAAHTLSTGASAHPAMYFVVWDMFCGWGAYSNRTHIIAEGASGTYYDITAAPWGDFKPFGSVSRHNYDLLGIHLPRVANNVLKHTQHEPITRVLVIEELWPKKYNLRDDMWAKLHNTPKDVHSYYNLWAVLDGDGQPVNVYPNWISKQAVYSVSNNPRLHQEASASRPFFTNLQKPWSAGSIRPRSPLAKNLQPSQIPTLVKDAKPGNGIETVSGEVHLPEQNDIRVPAAN
ncbi:MAG: hypothetical protein O3A00_11940 [Planctomycetota bacterium]|nr:hypothetical protein [Planctomycetota bacterium]